MLKILAMAGVLAGTMAGGPVAADGGHYHTAHQSHPATGFYAQTHGRHHYRKHYRPHRRHHRARKYGYGPYYYRPYRRPAYVARPYAPVYRWHPRVGYQPFGWCPSHGIHHLFNGVHFYFDL